MIVTACPKLLRLWSTEYAFHAAKNCIFRANAYAYAYVGRMARRKRGIVCPQASFLHLFCGSQLLINSFLFVRPRMLEFPNRRAREIAFFFVVILRAPTCRGYPREIARGEQRHLIERLDVIMSRYILAGIFIALWTRWQGKVIKQFRQQIKLRVSVERSTTCPSFTITI